MTHKSSTAAPDAEDRRARLAAALLPHYPLDPADADGYRACACGQWREGPDEAWEQHTADIALAAAGDEQQRAETALAGVLGIVSAWCVEANECGGVDATDLAWRLKQAGHQLPDTDGSSE